MVVTIYDSIVMLTKESWLQKLFSRSISAGTRSSDRRAKLRALKSGLCASHNLPEKSLTINYVGLTLCPRATKNFVLRVASLLQAQHRLRSAGDANSPCRQRQLHSRLHTTAFTESFSEVETALWNNQQRILAQCGWCGAITDHSLRTEQRRRGSR